MTTSRRRRPESPAPPVEAWPEGQICFSIVMSFPFPSAATISREDLALAVRSLGFVPSGARFGISIVLGSVTDLVNAGVTRELREREEKRLASMQRVPVRRPTPVPDLDEAANG